MLRSARHGSRALTAVLRRYYGSVTVLLASRVKISLETVVRRARETRTVSLRVPASGHSRCPRCTSRTIVRIDAFFSPAYLLPFVFISDTGHTRRRVFFFFFLKRTNAICPNNSGDSFTRLTTLGHFDDRREYVVSSVFVFFFIFKFNISIFFFFPRKRNFCD